MNRPRQMTIFKYFNDENKYKIYENGDVFSIRRDKFLTPIYSKIRNCLYISLVVYGKNKKFVVHTLIYTLFKSKLPKTHYISHIDNDTKNNNINNLIVLARNRNIIEVCNIIGEWKEIPLYENRYLINKEGYIKSLLTNKLLKENTSQNFTPLVI